MVIFFSNDASALSMSSGFVNLSLNPSADTLTNADSLKVNKPSKDTTNKSLKLEYDLVRHASDSIVQNLKNKKVYLYGNAEITYGNIDLKAAYISINFNNNTVFAKGLKDSTGKVIGLPEFKQGNEIFNAQTILYNFVSKKGIIHNVTTKQDQGFLHGDKVKRMPNNSINVKGGYFTTCPLPNPHYEFRFNKARVIPNKLIITGPVYMEVEGIPLPIVLPFGIFPDNPKRKSGLIIPSYGESANRGFYFQGGGYFWAINDKMTLKVTGDIYTGGSWKIAPVFTYKKRYKYGGSFSLGLSRNVISTKGAPDYSSSRDFRIMWSYRQDPKARPNSTFSASVNIISSNYVKYNIVNTNEYLSNQFQSSISYQKNWDGKYFLTVNASQSQNTLNHQVQVILPEVSFSVNRFYPFRKRNSAKQGLLNNLSVSYNMNSENSINATDTTLFTPSTFRKMQNGIINRIPISLPMKLFKHFTLSTAINITDRMYANSLRTNWVNDTLVQRGKTYVGYAKTDTIPGFNNEFDFSLSTSLSTKIFGILRFKKGPIRAIRHVITPSIGLSYIPDFSSNFWGYMGHYNDSLGNRITYSKYKNFTYGAPPTQKSGDLNFSISNSLEIKVPSKKDTVTGLKKIPIIQNFNISGNYNFAKDSVRMSDIYLSGRTTLWKGLTIQYNGILSPYAVDSLGQRINKTVWQVSRKLFRMNNSSWSLSFNYSLSQKDFQRKKKVRQKVPPTTENSGPPTTGIRNPPETQVDWKVPWSLSLNYHFTYSNIKNYINYVWTPHKTLIQTLGFSGQLSLSRNWKFSFNSGWDFTNKQLSFTSVNIYRNLGCWEMSFSWIPLGPRRSWNFTLQIKAALLKGLKLTKRKDFRDNY